MAAASLALFAFRAPAPERLPSSRSPKRGQNNAWELNGTADAGPGTSCASLQPHLFSAHPVAPGRRRGVKCHDRRPCSAMSPYSRAHKHEEKRQKGGKDRSCETPPAFQLPAEAPFAFQRSQTGRGSRHFASRGWRCPFGAVTGPWQGWPASPGCCSGGFHPKPAPSPHHRGGRDTQLKHRPLCVRYFIYNIYTF